MATKAFKLKVGEIKSLCDFFMVDRSTGGGKGLTKEDLVDRLLDFLGAPDVKYTKAYSKKRSEKVSRNKKGSTKKSGGSKDDGNEDVEDEDNETEEEKEEDEEDKQTGKMPNDKALRKWVKAYVTCFNLDKATTKHAIETASDKFGVNLASKKALIKELLTEEM